MILTNLLFTNSNNEENIHDYIITVQRAASENDKKYFRENQWPQLKAESRFFFTMSKSVKATSVLLTNVNNNVKINDYIIKVQRES